MGAEERSELDAWLADPTSLPDDGDGESVWDTAGDVVRLGGDM